MNDDQNLAAFLEDAARELEPKVRASAWVLHVTPDDERIDPKLAIETGYAVLLNKPIIAVTPKGRTTLPSIERIAHATIELEHDFRSPEGQAELQARVMPLLREEPPG